MSLDAPFDTVFHYPRGKDALQAREGLTGFTHFLQLFNAGCMHYNLAGCTLTPGERFLLEEEKREGKTCM